MRRTRRGSGMLELLVALPLVALLGLVAVQLLITVQRTTVRDDASRFASRELRQATAILLAELRMVGASDVLAWTTTSIEFQGPVGAGIVCGTRDSTLYVVGDESAAARVPTDNAPDSTGATWLQPVQSADRVTAWLQGRSMLDTLRPHVSSVATAAGGAHCHGSPLLPLGAAPTTSLTLAGGLPGNVAIGTPVTVQRRYQFALYSASDGGWYLGRRTFGPAGWDVIQPVAGPLASASERGLVVTVRDRRGGILTAASDSASRVDVAVRAPRPPLLGTTRSAIVDSLTVSVALRGARP
ncbi:MAG: hypothetical protein IT353_06285 [Gemmatimonadaceae bacterium]|nr:hypothetical protein [Gemmatimonadaceae bacterium]